MQSWTAHFAMAVQFCIEEPIWEQTKEQTNEEAFWDYMEELTNWVFTMDTAEWVLKLDDIARGTASLGKSTVVKKKNQIVWAHLPRHDCKQLC